MPSHLSFFSLGIIYKFEHSWYSSKSLTSRKRPIDVLFVVHHEKTNVILWVKFCSWDPLQHRKRSKTYEVIGPSKWYLRNLRRNIMFFLTPKIIYVPAISDISPISHQSLGNNRCKNMIQGWDELIRRTPFDGSWLSNAFKYFRVTHQDVYSWWWLLVSKSPSYRVCSPYEYIVDKGYIRKYRIYMRFDVFYYGFVVFFLPWL